MIDIDKLKTEISERVAASLRHTIITPGDIGVAVAQGMGPIIEELAMLRRITENLLKRCINSEAQVKELNDKINADIKNIEKSIQKIEKTLGTFSPTHVDPNCEMDIQERMARIEEVALDYKTPWLITTLGLKRWWQMHKMKWARRA